MAKIPGCPRVARAEVEVETLAKRVITAVSPMCLSCMVDILDISLSMASISED